MCIKLSVVKGFFKILHLSGHSSFNSSYERTKDEREMHKLMESKTPKIQPYKAKMIYDSADYTKFLLRLTYIHLALQTVLSLRHGAAFT